MHENAKFLIFEFSKAM